MERIRYTTQDGIQYPVPVYEGRIIYQMPKIIKANQTPLSIKEIIEQRVNSLRPNEWTTLAYKWCSHYFDSRDSIMYHPDGRVKIVTNSQTILSVNKDTPLKDGGLQVLPDGTFNKTEGDIEFTKEEIETFNYQNSKKQQYLEELMWMALVQNNKTLLDEYRNLIYLRPNKTNRQMEIYIPNVKTEVEVEGILSIDGCSSSTLFVNNMGRGNKSNPNIINARLVGVNSERL